MSKRLRVVGNQRIDLEDFVYGTSGFTVAELKAHVQQLVSELMGVIEGFDVALDGPPGTATNIVRIYNGAALDPSLQLVRIEDAPNAVVTMALEGAGLHHVGVLFRVVPSDTDARYFWDPSAANPDGTTGREFTQEVRTRLSVTWQPVDALDDPSFKNSGIDTPGLVIPICVVPVVTTGGLSVIDETRLITEQAVGKVLTIDASDPIRTRLRLVNARLFRVGTTLSVPISTNAYSVDQVDPVKNEIVVTPAMPPVDQARAVALGFVVNRAATAPPSSWGFRFIRSVGRLADPRIPGDASAPGDVRPRLFEGDPLRGEKLLGRPADDPDRLGATGERITGREEDALGTAKNLRDALAFVLSEAKFARPGTWTPAFTGQAVPKWMDPVPVPLWDIARLYFRELNGTGVVSGGPPAALGLSPGPSPGRWSANVSFPETIYYSAGIRHRMPPVVDVENFSIAPPAGLLFVYWWATPQPNTTGLSAPLTGPDWQTAPTRIQFTHSNGVFNAEPPAPTARSVLLGAVRFDNSAGGVLPTPTLINMARVPRRVPDLLGPDAGGRLQRDLVFKTWAALGDPGRKIGVDDPQGRLNVDVGAGAILVHSRGVVTLLHDFPGGSSRPGSVQGRQAAASPLIMQLDPTGLDLAGASGVRLWDQQIGAPADLRGGLQVGADRGGGLTDFGARVAGLVGASGNAAAPGAVRLDANDARSGGVWKDGTVIADAEVLEARRRVRLMGQAAMINVDRDAGGNPIGGPQGFNFLNPYKVPLAWAYLTLSGGIFSLRAQSHYLNSNGGPAPARAASVWIPPFASPVAPPDPLVEIVGPTRAKGAVYGFQLPWSPWFRPTAPTNYIVTLSATPSYDVWKRHSLLGPAGRIPYDTIPQFASSADVAWAGFGRDLGFASGTTLHLIDGPLIVYTHPAASVGGLEGVMVQVWGTLGMGSAAGAPVNPTDTYLGSV